MKNIRIFYLKNCHFLVVKFSVYLNRRVFVMSSNETESPSFVLLSIRCFLWHFVYIFYSFLLFCTQRLLSGSFLKGKNLLPLAANSFLFEKTRSRRMVNNL